LAVPFAVYAGKSETQRFYTFCSTFCWIVCSIDFSVPCFFRCVATLAAIDLLQCPTSHDKSCC